MRLRRRSTELLRGVHLNTGGMVPSLSFGHRGVVVNTSARGTYVTASLPGTGLRYRKRLAPPDPKVELAVDLLQLTAVTPASRARKRSRTS